MVLKAYATRSQGSTKMDELAMRTALSSKTTSELRAIMVSESLHIQVKNDGSLPETNCVQHVLVVMLVMTVVILTHA